MSERMLNRDLRKQIGCMNGIFQFLDPNHFLSGWRVNGRNHKRLIQGAQHHEDPNYAPKAVMAEDLEVQKEKSSSSMESSRPSYSSSSSCSSMFSSLECSRTVKPESLSLRQTEIGMAETRSQSTSMKEQKSNDLQDVVKDSLYKQVHGLSVKCRAKDETRGRVLKHVDSPRPLELPKYVKPKAKSAEGSTRVLAKLQDRTNSSTNERLALPRLSYDGRESRETSKSMMKLKELPRLSLDSRAGTMKCSALESRLDFVGCDLPIKNEKWSKVPQGNQEPGSHNRSSSLVARLMGLESFPDKVASSDSTITNTTSPKEDFVLRSSPKAENSNQNHVCYSPQITRNDPASPRLPTSNSDWKPSTRLRFPMEPAPWRNQDSSQDSPKVASQCRTDSTNIQHRSSVYGEIEKRITELEFKRSGKDLRTLKRILEAMQKTRERLENQTGESGQCRSHTRTYSLDESSSDRNYCSSMCRDKKNHQEAFTINEQSLPQITDSAIVIMKPATVMDREKLSRSTQVSRMSIQHLQRFRNQDPKQNRDNSVHKQAADDRRARKNDFSVSSPRYPSIEKITERTSKVEQTLKASPRMKAKGCNTFGRSSESVSPRLTENRGRIERQSNPTTPSSHSGRVKRHSINKVIEKGPSARELDIKSTNLQLNDDQFSERTTETRYSSNQGRTASIKSEDEISLFSQIATEVTGIVCSINTSTKTCENSVATLVEHMPAEKIAATMMEQPSPVSVLDTTIYEEDSPSPIKMISTAFQEDEGSNPDKALWNPEKLGQLAPDPCYNHNQKTRENIKHLIHELRLLKIKPDEVTAKETASVDVSPNQDHRYINKMILTSGLLEDVKFISMTDQPHSSSHLINPNMFHILEQTEEDMDDADGGHNRKNRSFSPGRKRVSPQVLIREIYLEVDRLQQKAECNLDEEDGLNRILNADMMRQSEEWAEYGVEVPALVLDIERLIFKDLINDVVASDNMGLHNWPNKHCRQLFIK
ncbi:protein LONGIFOLIA 1 [Dorcoceras hygrometricum]|uniref:Protein LONGIFOLIA 1 n=1 Tax=Dorcoceras hygrometricum TaxID=472368 RepID=A0A2Z7CG71_9LAMI|nr:protein LONGIFOLIA 1 [Dorcoceras hygrometricum]